MRNFLKLSAEDFRRGRRWASCDGRSCWVLSFPICGGRDVSWDTAEALVASVCGALSESTVNADMLPPYLPKVCRHARCWLARQRLSAVPAFEGPHLVWDLQRWDALKDVMRMIAIVRICSEDDFRNLLSADSKASVDLFCRTMNLETLICNLGCAVFSVDGGNSASEWNLEE